MGSPRVGHDLTTSIHRHLCHNFGLEAGEVALVVKNPIAKAGDIRDLALTPGLGRSPGRGHGNPLRYDTVQVPWLRNLTLQ